MLPWLPGWSCPNITKRSTSIKDHRFIHTASQPQVNKVWIKMPTKPRSFIKCVHFSWSFIDEKWMTYSCIDSSIIFDWLFYHDIFISCWFDKPLTLSTWNIYEVLFFHWYLNKVLIFYKFSVEVPFRKPAPKLHISGQPSILSVRFGRKFRPNIQPKLFLF